MTIRRHAHTYATRKGVSAPCVNTLRQHTARVLHVASGSKPPRHVLSRCQSSQSRPELASHHLAPLVSSELTRRRRSLLMAAAPSLPRLSPFRSALETSEPTKQVAGLPRSKLQAFHARARACAAACAYAHARAHARGRHLPPAAHRSPPVARRSPPAARTYAAAHDPCSKDDRQPRPYQARRPAHCSAL